MSNIPAPPPGFQLVPQTAAPAPPPPGFRLVQPAPAAPALPPGTDAATGLPMAVAPPSLDVPASPEMPDESGQFDEIMRALQIGAQGAGRGLADLAGLPGDISTAAFNFPLSAADAGMDMIFGDASPEFLDFRFPPSPVGSDAIADVAGGAAERAGMDLIGQDEMTGGERMRYNANRFGTQAAVTAGGLTSAAARSGASTSAAPRVRDAFTYPYSTPNAGRALVGDTMGGAGAGLAFSAAQDSQIFDDPVMQAIFEVGALMAGGVAGNVAGAGVSSPGAAIRSIQAMTPDPTVPLPQTGPPTTTPRGVADDAARVLQDQAANLSQAQANLEANTRAARNAGSAVPTPGTLTEDPGLLALEQGFRSRGSAVEPNMPSRFQGRDEAVRGSAAERVESLRNPNADQAGALDYIRSRPAELRSERDAAALPLLRQAEASGAVIDASPVASILDTAMQGPKRPEVVRALKAARDSLNASGTDEIDTSLSGLYETRKVLNDLIDGRSESNTGRFARGELIEAKKALDKILVDAVPEFGQYLDEFRAGSRPLDVFDERTGQRLLDSETDLRNVARQILSPSRYGTEDVMAQVNQMVAGDPTGAAAAGWKAAVADVLVDKVKTSTDDISYANIRKVYEQNREALGQIFTPEEMTRIEEAQTLLRLVNQNRGSSRGVSPEGTDPRAAVEASLFAMGYNAVTIGMIMKRINVAANFMGLEKHTRAFKTSRLLERAAFDPDLYDLLIKRPVTEEPGPLWNDRVRKLLSRGEIVRNFAGEEEDDEMMQAIGSP